MAGAAVKHDYHLVDPSPWPFVGSVAAFIMAVGGVIWMRTGAEPSGLFGITGSGVFWAGFAGVLFTMLGWWRDVIKESLAGESTTQVVRLGLRYGMVLFIASEIMFFVAWFWAYFNTALFPGAGEAVLLADGAQMLNAEGLPAFFGNDARYHFTGNVFPPEGVETLDPWHLPLINTLILLLSGTTVTWAHHAMIEGDRSGVIQGLWITVVLGAFFSVLQGIEYNEAIHEGLFTFSGQIYGATFFMATGFHGFHVLVGTIFLAVCLVRTYLNQFTPERHFGFEAAAWYWHFVDVVWLFLFACIYVLGGGSGGAH
ncbi:MAG: cytochrome c oxidase subunit 3 [Pseudomonadota bacterium]